MRGPSLDQSFECGATNSLGMLSQTQTVELEKSDKQPQDDHNEDEEECDTVSVASSRDSRVECDGAVMLNDAQDRSPCFQNIEVTNSSDVHFGNKTIYQGPVTIKQILYTNPSQPGDEPNNSDRKLPITDVSGIDNNVYVPDGVNGAVKNTNISASDNHNNNWTNKTKGKKWLQRRTSKQLIFGTAILMLVMVSVIALVVALLTTRDVPLNRSTLSDIGEEVGGRPANDPEAVVNIIVRRGWVAEPPKFTTPLHLPVAKVIFVETFTDSCVLEGACVFLVRHLQTAHKEGYSLWDIKYNFLVGGDGNVYEGRGWKTLSSTIVGCNQNSLGIAFIGTFPREKPPEKQVNAAKRLLNMGVSRKYIRPDYQLVYGSQLLGESNGSSKKLEEIIETWPHWSNVDYFHNDTLKQEFCNS